MRKFLTSFNGVGPARILVTGLATLLSSLAFAQSPGTRNGLSVSIPNGYANISVVDMSVRSSGGDVRWMHVWNGLEWKFNPHWESLSQSLSNLTGSTMAGTRLSSEGSGSDDSNCKVTVDEDWKPRVETVLIDLDPHDATMEPERSTPFNRRFGDKKEYPPPFRVNIDYAALCAQFPPPPQTAQGVQDLEAIRRQSELYLGDAGRYAFSNRAVLEKRRVNVLPVISSSAPYGALGTGQISLAGVSGEDGFRWLDKAGDWIDYNMQGQVVAYGDKNNNIVWMQRDVDGLLRGVVDATGRVVYTLHYTGALVTEVRDYPIPGNALDLPARKVQFQYDDLNRLTVVTDVRGNTVSYAYNTANQIVKITDQEGRIEQISYSGEFVAKRVAPDGGITDYEFEYDDVNKQFSSKIIGPETAAGRIVERHTHDRSGRLIRRITNGRIDEEVRYDSGARAEMSTNARGFTKRTVSNEFDQTVELDQEDGSILKWTFSPLNLALTEKADELGTRTQYQYDGAGNLLKEIRAIGAPEESVTEYTVNSQGWSIKVVSNGRTEANGTVTPDAAWQFEYDSLGQIRKKTDPEGNVWRYVYNRIGNLVSETDPRGNTVQYMMNADGQLTQTMLPMGRNHTFGYDKAGNVVSATNGRGKTVRASYDTMNRRKSTVNLAGGVRRVDYNGQGQLVSATDEDGSVQRWEYDNFLRLNQYVDGLNNITAYGYTVADGTANGAIGALAKPTETFYPTFTSRTRFDELERPTSETLIKSNASGTESLVSTVAYDKRGQVKVQTDANGKFSSYAYGADGNVLSTTDRLGNMTAMQFDARGNLIRVADAKGGIYRFEYDRNDRKLKEILPMGQATAYTYDPVGNLASRINPNGIKTTYSYDEANRLQEEKRYGSEHMLAGNTTYSWDLADNLIAWSDTDLTRPSGQQTVSAALSYDDANRKTGETVNYPTSQGGLYTLSYAYSYTLGGKKATLTWPNGEVITYAYSNHGELEAVTIPGEGSISVNQFKWTAPAKVTLPGGSIRESEYDGLFNLLSFNLKGPDQKTILEVSNTFDKLQALKRSVRIETAVGGITTSAYTYDDEQRLTLAASDTGGLSEADSEAFALDALGNRIAHSKMRGTWEYDANNRLLQRGSGSAATVYQYDDAGNLVQRTESGKVTNFSYNAQNRLSEVRDGNGSPIARYAYDPLGRRIWKEQYRAKDGTALAQALRTYYLYADEGLIAEATQSISLGIDKTSVSNEVPSVTVQYGLRPNERFNTGVLFLKTKNSNNQDTVAYFHHDRLGTPIAATDRAGNILWAAVYNAFGAADIITPAARQERPTIVNNLRLPGQIEDAETGLHYNYFRDYDPQTGRYIESDPIGFMGGINPYTYVGGNPLTWFDPLGLARMSYDDLAPIVATNNASGLSNELLICLIWKETSFDPSAAAKTSTATGLMQMTKGAVADVARNDSGQKGITHSDMTDAGKNVRAGSSYLGMRIKRAGGDVTKGLNGFGTGAGYSVNILECEKCLKKMAETSQSACADPKKCLDKIHK